MCGRNRRAWLVAAAGLALAGGRAGAQAVWTNGTGNGLWHTAGNWSTGAVPGVTTTVTIPGGGSGVSAQGPISVASINAMGPVAIGGGGSVLAQGGTFTDLSTTNSAMNAGGPVLISGTSHMAGATFYGGFEWKNTGTMTVNPGLGVNAPTIFLNEGTVNIEFSVTLAGSAALMMNTGSLKLVNQGRMHSSGLLTNQGELRKTGRGLSTIEPRLLNGGAILVDAGTLALAGSATFTGGGVNVSEGCTLRLEHPSGEPHIFNGMKVAGGSGSMVIQTLGAIPPAVQVIDEVRFNFTGIPGLHLFAGSMQLDDIARNQGRMTWNSYAFHGIGEFHNEAGGTVLLPFGGSGTIQSGATFVNKGQFTMGGPLNVTNGVFANNAGGVVDITQTNLQGSPLTGRARNRGTINARAGSCEIGIPFDQSDGGKTEAMGGTLAFTAGGQWGFGGGQFKVSGVNTLLSLNGAPAYTVVAGNHTIHGDGEIVQNAGTTVVVEPGATLTLAAFASPPSASSEYRLQGGMLGGLGTITNNGQFDCVGTIGVNAEADFRNNGLTYIRGGVLTGTFTNNATRQVFHSGNWNVNGGKAINNGEWVCVPSVAIGLLLNAAGEFRNNDHFVFVPPTIVGGGVFCKFDNAGLVTVVRGTLQFSGPVVQLQNGALTGGIWEVFPGATLILPPPLTKITTGAKVIGARTGQVGVQGLNAVTEISQDGSLEATGDTNFDGQLNVVNGGKLLVRAPATVSVPQRLYSGWMPGTTRVEQKKQGEGPTEPRIVTVAFENNATAAPGGAGEAGPFNLTGTYLQMHGGELEIEIGGAVPIEDHDRMDVTGPASLAGTLRLDLLNGFIPTPGESFMILTATGGVSGRFTTVVQPPSMPPGLEFTVVYGPNAVSVRAADACYADCNTDGALSVADFGCFQSLFVGGHTYADCNGDGSLGVADFGCFQTAFVVGCP